MRGENFVTLTTVNVLKLYFHLQQMALFVLQDILAPIRDSFKETTVLRRAVEAGKVDQVTYLLHKGCEVNGRSGARGITPLIATCFIKDQPRRVKIFKLLLDYKADCSIGDTKNRNVVFYALAHQLTDVLEILLCNVDYNLNGCDIYGNTALHVAAMVTDLNIVKMFIKIVQKYQLSLSPQNCIGLTPLLMALLASNLSVALTLHVAGACPKLSSQEIRRLTNLLMQMNNGGDQLESIDSLFSVISTTDSSSHVEPVTPAIKVQYITNTGSLVSVNSQSSRETPPSEDERRLSEWPALPFLLPQGTRVSTQSYKSKDYVKVTSEILMMSQLLRQTCPSLQLSLGIFPIGCPPSPSYTKLPLLKNMCQAVSYDGLAELVSTQRTRSYCPPSRLGSVDQSWLQCVSSYNIVKKDYVDQITAAPSHNQLTDNTAPLLKRESSSSRLGSRASLQSCGKMRKRLSVTNYNY